MNAKLKKKWIEALIGEQYEQGRGGLRDGDRYCCLGVLCDIAELKWVDTKDTYTYAMHRTNMSFSFLPTSFRKKIGITEEAQSHLIDMNDCGNSFKKIANWIEKNL